MDAKDYFKATGYALLLILTLGLLGFAGNMIGLFRFGFFAPKVEQVRYNTFKESQSYNDGMIRDLEDIKREYMKATPDQQAALRGIALHRFGVYPSDKLPADLQTFYQSISQ